jgi:hypothetical protein
MVNYNIQKQINKFWYQFYSLNSKKIISIGDEKIFAPFPIDIMPLSLGASCSGVIRKGNKAFAIFI